jgi:hypothetical protein
METFWIWSGHCKLSFGSLAVPVTVTSRGRVLVEKTVMAQLAKKLSAWNGNRRSPHVFTRASTHVLRPVQDFVASHYFTVTLSERRGWVVNIPVSFSGGPKFKSRPGDRISWMMFSWLYSVSPGESRDSNFKLVHDRFLPNPSQFCIRSSAFHSTLYSLSFSNSVVK